MTDAAEPAVNLRRRQLLRGLTVALGVTLSPSCSRALTSGSNLHAAPPAGGKSFSESEAANVAALADVLLPATNTPGALAAGVPNFLANLFADWMTDAERSELRAGLAELDAAASGHTTGKQFSALLPAGRQAVVSAAFAEFSGFDEAAVRALAGDKRPYLLQLRDLVVLGFYTSKVGATQALNYNPVPGFYDGAYPVAKAGTHWSY